jgi:hypothetical protein
MGNTALKRLLLIIAATIAMMVDHAYAATIVYRFDGQVFDATLGGIPDGTPYFGIFSYETDSPNLGTIPDIGVYEYNSFQITVGADTIFADLSGTASGSPPRITINNTSDSLDDFIVNANPAGGSLGTYASVLAFNVYFSGTNVFDDISLPGTDLTRGDFEFAGVSGVATLSSGVSVNFQGTVESLQAVPIPASLWLFGTGALGLTSIARRKRA